MRLTSTITIFVTLPSGEIQRIRCEIIIYWVSHHTHGNSIHSSKNYYEFEDFIIINT